MKQVATIALALALSAPAAAMQRTSARGMSEPGRLIMYERKNYGGDSVTIDEERRILNILWSVNSVAIHPGDRWQLCNRGRFQEPCIVLDRSVPDMSVLGAAGEIASARPMPGQAPGN